MLRESVRDFALAKLRPAAQAADDACATPPELLSQSNELGLTMVGVPEELGGAVAERSAVTTVLMAEALAARRHGHRRGVPRARPPSRPRSACGATPTSRPPTCPRSSARTCPAAALALLEPRAAVQPVRASSTAPGAPAAGFVLDGRQVARPARRRRRAVHRRRRARGRTPRAVHRRAGRTAACRSSPSRRWDSRGAATGAVAARGREAPGRARCSATTRRPSPSACSSGGSAGARWPSAPARPCSTT